MMLLHSGAGDEATAASVRRHLQTLSGELDRIRPGLLADLQLVATELITNAVGAGAHRIAVHLEIPPPHIEVHVGDDALGMPSPRQPAETDTHGRGLQIVAALADDWGTERTAGGKTVWARFTH